MFKKDLQYATKIWLFSVVVTPILFIILPLGFFNMGDATSLQEAAGLYFLMFFYGGILSVPCWLVFMLLVRLITRMERKTQNKKIFIQVGALLIGIVPFLLFFGVDDLEVLVLAVPYLVTLTFGIWYFSWEYRKVPNAEILDDLLN